MRLSPFNPYIAIIIGVISISSTVIFVKLASSIPVSVTLFYQLLFASLLMAPVIIIKYRQELKLLDKKDWILALISSVFFILHFLLWFESIRHTSIVSSVVLVSLQPVFIFITAFLFFREKFSYGAVISMIITFLGSFIILTGDANISRAAFFGDLLAIISVIMVTCYFIFSQQARKRVAFLTYTFIIYSFGSFLLMLYILLMQYSFFDYESKYWFTFLGLAIFPTFLGHLLFNWTVKWLHVSTTSMAIVFEPVSAVFLAYLIFNDHVLPFQLLGSTIILFGLFLFIVSTSRKRHVTISDVSKTRKSSAHSRKE